LCSRLRALDYEVVGLVDAPPSAGDEVIADLRDSAAIARAIDLVRPDRVVHLAAVSFVAHDKIEEIYRINLLGTLGLLQALSEQDRLVRSVVLASSANVYGDSKREMISESVAPAPVNHYAASKLAMEHMAATFRDRLPIVIARPFNYTGPGQSEQFLVPKIVGHFRRCASDVELGNIDVVREFMDVRAVADIYCKLLACEAAIGETVNICSGRGFALLEIVRLLEAETGHKLEIHINPQLVRTSELRRLVGSPERLISLVGPVEEIPLAATLRDMLAQG
jgi:nucleoside-diphosphate-sugar epimerase